MAHKFPSMEWLQALAETLNTDEEYAETAKKWEGEIAFFIEPGGPIESAQIFCTDLWHGKCRSAFIIENEEQLAELAPAFILRATYPIFTQVLKGRLDPMQAMITRKLKVKGSMGYMMRNVPTVLSFVRCAKEVETEFI